MTSERHISPDGLLQLIVDRASDGDWTIGFEGYAWHTHANILNAWGYDGTPEARIRAFIDDITNSRRLIAVRRTNQNVSDIFVPDDPGRIDRYAPENETTELRYWDGRVGTATDN
jgi:hypothetical protein